VGIRSVLVVGAGIAGSTLAYFLARTGITVTVVERANEQRSSGSPVDVRGPALAVVEQMNLLAPIRAAATRARRLAAVDSSGRVIGWIPHTVRPRGNRDSAERPRCHPGFRRSGASRIPLRRHHYGVA
jgi:2-polyprenyl-6-methoxyphenol hydroxylase-like FAD-dependent oxidoreductase